VDIKHFVIELLISLCEECQGVKAKEKNVVCGLQPSHQGGGTYSYNQDTMIKPAATTKPPKGFIILILDFVGTAWV